MITVVLTVKNRPEKEVFRCVESLLFQKCKIIIVDYGSSEDNLKWERDILKNTNVLLIEVKNDTEIFNKSRALNIGIKVADTEYVMAGDIDLVYAKNLIVEITKVMDTNKLISIRRFNTSSNGKIIRPSVRSYGGCIVLLKEWLYKVHGFDENFTGWGHEDSDIIDRAIADGLTYEILPAKVTRCFHQFHKQENINNTENDTYYNVKNKQLIRNLARWGII